MLAHANYTCENMSNIKAPSDFKSHLQMIFIVDISQCEIASVSEANIAVATAQSVQEFLVQENEDLGNLKCYQANLKSCRRETK